MAENQKNEGRKIQAGSDAEVDRVTKQQEEMDQALVDAHRREVECPEDLPLPADQREASGAKPYKADSHN